MEQFEPGLQQFYPCHRKKLQNIYYFLYIENTQVRLVANCTVLQTTFFRDVPDTINAG